MRKRCHVHTIKWRVVVTTMHIYNWKVRTIFEFTPETVDEEFDSHAIMKQVEKVFGKKPKRVRTLKKEMR